MPIVDRLLVEAVSSASQLTVAQQEIVGRIEKLRSRLADRILRIAILGQFKRGKSTLLNALLETPLLPTGITPVTSIPTFIKYGEGRTATITFKDGKEPIVVSNPSEIGGVLTRYVSETNNPENVFSVGGVDLALPSKFLSQGIILIDTPGIGSTFRHNTAAAEAFLPECDAAVLVLSADPPITDMEVTYLNKIRETIPKLVFVLNKVDLLTDDERTCAIQFLHSQLKQRITTSEIGTIICISARAGLEAKLRHDEVAFQASGVATLQTYLATELMQERSSIVHAAALNRSVSLVRELLFQNELEQKSLLLPQAELEKKRDVFESATLEFESDRQTLSDVLSISRNQVIRELESETDSLWKNTLEYARTLSSEASSQPVTTVRDHVSRSLADYFDEAFPRILKYFQQRITESLSMHRDKAVGLIRSVRQAAADIMEIPFADIHTEEVFETKHEPYWVTVEAPPSISNISTNALANLLPAAMRTRRERKQFNKEAEAAVLRNVANLDWAIRQNVADAFRRFEFSLDQQLATAVKATREALSVTVQRHQDRRQELHEEIEERSRAINCLSKTLNALQSLNAKQTHL